MGSSNLPADPKKAPLAIHHKTHPDIVHQNHEWSSGTRGGGKVPADLTWPSNPKQDQEENGNGFAK
jgi:hypothetical protein